MISINGLNNSRRRLRNKKKKIEGLFGFGTLKLTHLEGERQPKIDPPDRDLWQRRYLDGYHAIGGEGRMITVDQYKLHQDSA